MAVRFFTQWSCAAITLLAQWQSVAVPREFWLGMVARSVFGVASMVCHLPLLFLSTRSS